MLLTFDVQGPLLELSIKVFLVHRYKPRQFDSNLLTLNPQFDISCDLCRFSTVDDLKSFVMSLEGVDVGEPVSIESSDGDAVVSIKTLLPRGIQQ